MANENDAPKPRGVQGLFAAIFTPKNPNATQSEEETRERIRTLDETERKWGWAAAALPLALAVSDLFIKYKVSPITAKPEHGQCVAGFRLDKSTGLCTQIATHSAVQSHWVTAVIFVLGLVLLYGVWSAKRSFAAFAAFFAGIASGTLGLILVFYGGWLLVRAWRIQRYGAADGKTVRKVSMERAAERKAAKKAGAAETLQTGKVVPPPSKRYTPKSKPKKR